MRNLRVCLGESVRASLRRHPSSSSINHINTSPRARATRRVGNRSILQCGLFLFPSHLNTTNDQHRPFRTHESSMVSHTPRRPTHHQHFSSRTTETTCRERTNEPNRNEPKRTETNRTEDGTHRWRTRARRPTRLHSTRRAAGIHPIHPSTVGGGETEERIARSITRDYDRANARTTKATERRDARMTKVRSETHRRARTASDGGGGDDGDDAGGGRRDGGPEATTRAGGAVKTSVGGKRRRGRPLRSAKAVMPGAGGGERRDAATEACAEELKRS